MMPTMQMLHHGFIAPACCSGGQAPAAVGHSPMDPHAPAVHIHTHGEPVTKSLIGGSMAAGSVDAALPCRPALQRARMGPRAQGELSSPQCVQTTKDLDVSVCTHGNY